MLIANWTKYTLDFTFEARTSRGSMWHKPTYFLTVYDDSDPALKGIGECNLFKGLSADDVPEYEAALDAMCRSGLSDIPRMSSLIFGAECALADLNGGGTGVLFPSAWTEGTAEIPINGLVWMGDKATMAARINEKLNQGFRCLKLKIGGIRFDDELDLLAYMRSVFAPTDLEIRLDANGAFSSDDALQKLDRLSRFGIHSIEQPVKPGQYSLMSEICAQSPIPIALDEDLIGVRDKKEKAEMLEAIRPAYIILKPALCGGLAHADEWISEAEARGIGWWATSALESNIGLSAIAQWVAARGFYMPQGLGTGGLYSNNVPSKIRLKGASIIFEP